MINKLDSLDTKWALILVHPNINLFSNLEDWEWLKLRIRERVELYLDLRKPVYHLPYTQAETNVPIFLPQVWIKTVTVERTKPLERNFVEKQALAVIELIKNQKIVEIWWLYYWSCVRSIYRHISLKVDAVVNPNICNRSHTT